MVRRADISRSVAGMCLRVAAPYPRRRQIATGPSFWATASNHGRGTEMDGEEHPKRLARVLHDHISGQIAIALRNVELFEVYHEDDPVRARRRVQTAQEVLQDLMETLGTV